MDDPTRDSISRAHDPVIEEMSGLEGQLEKYEYLVGPGRELASPEVIRSDAYLVPGCQSQVWIRAELQGAAMVKRIRAFAEKWK